MLYFIYTICEKCNKLCSNTEAFNSSRISMYNVHVYIFITLVSGRSYGYETWTNKKLPKFLSNNESIASIIWWWHIISFKACSVISQWDRIINYDFLLSYLTICCKKKPPVERFVILINTCTKIPTNNDFFYTQHTNK